MRHGRNEARPRAGCAPTAVVVFVALVTGGLAWMALTEPAAARREYVQSGSTAPPAQPADPGAARPEPDLRRMAPPDAHRRPPRDNGSRDEESDDDGPGCPGNQNPLELLV